MLFRSLIPYTRRIESTWPHDALPAGLVSLIGKRARDRVASAIAVRRNPKGLKVSVPRDSIAILSRPRPAAARPPVRATHPKSPPPIRICFRPPIQIRILQA